jgi:hypothetical protein
MSVLLPDVGSVQSLRRTENRTLNRSAVDLARMVNTQAHEVDARARTRTHSCTHTHAPTQADPNRPLSVLCFAGHFCPEGSVFPDQFACPLRAGLYCPNGTWMPGNLCPEGSYCPTPAEKVSK